MTDQPSVHVDFPPVENGLDYLKNVVKLLAQDEGQVSPRTLKYAVLHLQAATEVLLKYRLSFEHWTLVLHDLDLSKKNPGKRVTREMFDAGEFVSCQLKETVLRLRTVVGLPIDPEDEEQILSLANSRNALQHYGLTDSEGTIEVRTAAVLDFLLRFLDDHLLPKLKDTDRERFDEDVEFIRSGLARIRAFVEWRMERLKVKLEPLRDRTVQCPHCRQWALVTGGELASCLFCPWTGDPRGYALDYVIHISRLPWRSTPTEGPFEQPAMPPIDPCPLCGVVAAVPGVATAAAPDHPTTFCFNCGVALPDEDRRDPADRREQGAAERDAGAMGSAGGESA
ncbi:hypothetical protein OG905_00990 [Streptomyces sp. NBC_00322]|uniref:hypothetical protein n=1 Tax=Streptomyces sp. NBC_00322 TaxID=2975712 RepID=UPI002E2AEE42|nr:hypothetical protein [Streptomyces sp. NBC_00322]